MLTLPCNIVVVMKVLYIKQQIMTHLAYWGNPDAMPLWPQVILYLKCTFTVQSRTLSTLVGEDTPYQRRAAFPPSKREHSILEAGP